MKKMLRKFMEYVDSSEFKANYDIFHKLPAGKFAVIKISGKLIEDELDVFAEDIAYLNKLDIFPIIVHGAGSTLDKKISSTRIDGLRVTSREDSEIMKETYGEISCAIKNAIIEKGGKAGIAKKCIFGHFLDKDKYGHVGDIDRIDLEPVNILLDNNITPIISPWCRYSDDILNINADTVAREVVRAIQPRKFILLTETGGILDRTGAIIPFTNLSEDDISHINGGMQLKVREIRQFLEENRECAVVITSAKNLLKEIFTIQGSGTFIKYYQIESTVRDFDEAKMVKLLEASFDKKLANEYFSTEIKEVFYEKNYEGAAIIKMIDGINYLDKFVVMKYRQGSGLGKSLMSEVFKKYDSLIWRASSKNQIKGFYEKNSDGMMKKNGWTIFWRNIADDRLIAIVNKVAALEKTMVD
ncbi:MAG: hypothetical protein V2J62_05495 [candidate division KSB1 bacterium]|jgi:acetylglutamate kinase|nr:hypothetical protein [candidate division KSB1 bacterium]